jgi:endonuclease/exonuclease/phosphatase family metal-dependent hydrolase
MLSVVLRFCFLILLLACLGGCASIPVDQLANHRAPVTGALGPDIDLWSWNMEKGHEGNWPGFATDPEVGHRLDNTDLLLLQEACIERDGGLRGVGELLAPRGFGWWAGKAFVSPWFGCGRGDASGVAIASRITPLQVTGLRSPGRELGVTPKNSLALNFDLKERWDHLLVVNAHLLNFQFLSDRSYRLQLRDITGLMAAHEGPLIFAGDLNTRNPYRTRLVRDVASALCLKPAYKGDDNRSRYASAGHYPLDHVYFRGLKLLQATVGDEAKRGYSDHNSLYVRFSTRVVPGEACRPDPDKAAAAVAQ